MNRSAIGAALVLLVLLVLSFATMAYAYPIGATATGTTVSSIGGAGLTHIFSQLVSVARGVGASFSLLPTGLWPAGTPASGSSNDWRSWLETWSFSVAGFHVVGFTTAALSVYSWLLGVTKSGVEWLLGVIH